MSSKSPEMVFTMGLPGAGKTTVLAKLGLTATHCIIDPDLFKQAHPDYDPKNPSALHAWSSLQAEAQLARVLKAGVGNWIVDGTGTNSDKMIRRIRKARAAGFSIKLVYVRVTLATALKRNATRARTVPEDVVRMKALDISVSFGLVAPEANKVEVVDND